GKTEVLPFTIEQFYKFLLEKRIMAAQCEECGAKFLPPRPICSNCYSKNFTWIQLKPQGKLITYTIIHIASQKFQPFAPYAYGIVELENGLRPASRALPFPRVAAHQPGRGRGPVRRVFAPGQPLGGRGDVDSAGCGFGPGHDAGRCKRMADVDDSRGRVRIVWAQPADPAQCVLVVSGRGGRHGPGGRLRTCGRHFAADRRVKTPNKDARQAAEPGGRG
ncbi:MAG TPA: Zn-ribbon domain-containing OB-fold protein, partial [Anaerolineae bacterium]|nr:Zn-ribbon domain-containing OB-fold protein [Anaerolineae bacterium]